MLVGKSIHIMRTLFANKLFKHNKKYFLSVAKDMEEAVKFDLGKVEEFDQIDKEFRNIDKNYKIKIPKLPFEKTYFEIIFYDKKHYAAIFYLSEGKVCGYTFCQGSTQRLHPSNNDLFLVPTHQAFIENELGEISITKDECIVPEEQALFSFAALILIIESIHIINCSNVITKDHKAGKLVNQKRKAKDKPPVYTYKTLHLDTSEQEPAKGHGGGTHASPRVHIRRGHIRRLTNGKTIWVQPCVVGKYTQGVVEKDYSLSDPTTIHTEIPIAH